jgi:hypothetical protein
MSSHILIPEIAPSSSSRSRKPVLVMASALTIFAIGLCVLSQTEMVVLSSFSRLHWSYDEVDQWDGQDCQHGSSQVDF